MKIKLAISPCPNDTYIFGPWILGLLEESAPISTSFLDIQELNMAALTGEYDVIKVSAAQFKNLSNNYVILDAGSAMGLNNGPLLISKKPYDIHEIPTLRIGVPGENTTAHHLLMDLFPDVTNKEFMLFSNIEDAVLSRKIDAGVIIHESRFNYAKKGLIKLCDLGEAWVAKYKIPIPLGIILVNKRLSTAEMALINQTIQTSIQYSKTHRSDIQGFIKNHAQEMDEDVIDQHIALYVNEYSDSMGETGREAIAKLLSLN